MGAVLVDPYHLELIDGREGQKPLPEKLHSMIQAFLIQWFGRELSKEYRALSELNVLCGPDRLVSDVTVTLRNSRYSDGDLADAPALCVEILSPGQTVGDLFDKANRLVKSGTSTCWVIWPERHKAWIYTSADLIEAAEVLDATLPDAEGEPRSLQVRVAEMWAELE